MNSKQISVSVLIFSLVLVCISVLYMNHLSQLVAQEEQKRVAIWAEATEQFILADEFTDIDFFTKIIEDNTSIPVYMTDANGEVLMTRNVKHPKKDPTKLHGPITVRISDEILQYIYYDDSALLTQLTYFPYVQVGLIILFVLIAVVALYIGLRSEQNKVWVGLSKETAHQLGTPISSLNAWQELLETKYPDDELIPEIRKDITRLNTIVERFSKVGSMPELRTEYLDQLVENTVEYMQTRFGKRVTLTMESVGIGGRDLHLSEALVSAPLFSWVIENLLKNAVDAGATSIILRLSDEGEMWQLDVIDNGSGINIRRPNRIFNPGFTTKKRGWGLGLSLCKRIVEDYHGGKLLLQKTEMGVGSTFRVLIKKSKDC